MQKKKKKEEAAEWGEEVQAAMGRHHRGFVGHI